MFSLMITSCKTGEKSIEYKVSFASNGGSIIGDVTIKEGIKFCEPTPPTKEGYTFGGWFKDYDLTIPYSFNEEITKNLTLYAKWIPNVIKCTIFFNTNDGMYVEPIVLNSGDKITNLPVTYKKGYDNIPFKIEKMLPGDAISQFYCVSITHDSKKKVRFGVIFDLTQKLSSVMMIKVEQLVPDNADVVLYDGLMKEFVSVDIDVASSDNKISELYYRVTVYTIGSEVGNEYVGESLEVDFTWQIC
jgi:uncharacterized repeat protein (TIGR02543 family)